MLIMKKMDKKNKLKFKTDISNIGIFSENTKIHQFANKVVQFSSQYGRESGNAYTASNIAKGSLEIYPKYGDFKEAFVLRTYGPWWRMSNINMKNSKKSAYGFISKDFVGKFNR
jgi:hypothetical protein